MIVVYRKWLRCSQDQLLHPSNASTKRIDVLPLRRWPCIHPAWRHTKDSLVPESNTLSFNIHCLIARDLLYSTMAEVHALDNYYLAITLLITIAYQLFFFSIAFSLKFDKLTGLTIVEGPATLLTACYQTSPAGPILSSLQ